MLGEYLFGCMIGEETEGAEADKLETQGDWLEALTVTLGNGAGSERVVVPAVLSLNIMWRESHENSVAE